MVLARRARAASVDSPIQQIRPVLHVHIHVRKQLAKPVKYQVEIRQDPPPGNLGDVVQGLARVVADSALGVVEGVQNGREENVQVEAGG